LAVFPTTVEKRVTSLAVLIGPFTTLIVTPFWSYDPINLGKVLVLATLSFSCLGLLSPYFNNVYRANKAIFLISSLFFVFLWSSFFFSGANKSQQFWGIWGRSTGILTYLSLLATLLIIVSLQKYYFYQRLVTWLSLTALIVGIYALVQLSGNDPIKWSAYAAFGTLGNVNFLSGFLGIATVAMTVLALSKGVSKRTRYLFVISTIASLAIVFQTDSIQGLIAFAAGLSLFVLVQGLKRGRLIFMSVLILVTSGLIALIFALFNKGPLAGLIYQVTIVFRADYMHAAIKMLLNNPLFGVGIDSYDDWYLKERGVISAFRTSFNRTANSAHNVALDIGSGGGVPLLIAYLLLIFLVLVSIYRGYKLGLLSHPIFCAAICAWFAYQVQAAVSINQVGVGVWGWIISGVVIGYPRMETKELGYKFSYDFFSDLKTKKAYASKSKSFAPNTPPPLPVLTSAIFAFLGFSLAFLPFKLDIDFRTAMNSAELRQMMEVARSPRVQAFQIAQVANAAFSNNFVDQGREMAELLVRQYPRNLFGWTLISSSPGFSSEQQAIAKEKIELIDPYQALCYRANPTDLITRTLGALPGEKQSEILKNWGIPADSFLLGLAPTSGTTAELIKLRISSFCG
jgi:O-antigen ligase